MELLEHRQQGAVSGCGQDDGIRWRQRPGARCGSAARLDPELRAVAQGGDDAAAQERGGKEDMVAVAGTLHRLPPAQHAGGPCVRHDQTGCDTDSQE
jgi:hypothetical protein